MMKTMVGTVLLMVLASGCATGPKTAVSGMVLDKGNVIYFEQSDRVPKDVLLAAHNEKDPMVSALGGIPPELIGQFMGEILKVVPEMSKSYSQERMYNALIGRRMLFIGYESPEQLTELNKIAETMGGSIEYVTPQDGPGAGVRTVHAQ